MQAGINNRKREQRSEKKRNTKRERVFLQFSWFHHTQKRKKKNQSATRGEPMHIISSRTGSIWESQRVKTNKKI